jgi:putative DNA primase/helicase
MASYYDFEDVRAACLAHCPDLLMKILPDGRVVGKYYHCANLQGGNGDSLKVNLRTGQWGDWALSDCHGGDIPSLYARIKGLEYVAAVRELGEKYNVPQKERHRTSAKDWQAVTPVPPSAYALKDGEPQPPGLKIEHVVAHWTYYDAAGEVLMFVVRAEPPNEKKSFRPLTFWRHRDGRTEWKAKALPAPWPLYNLPGLDASPTKIVVCEGEKAAVSAARLLPDWCAITWPGGSQNPSNADWNPVLRLPEARIVLWPDHDKPGEAAMTEVARLLGRDVEVVVPDDAWPKGYDVADLEKDGWDTARTEQWIEHHTLRVAKSTETPRIEVNISGHDLYPQVVSIYQAIKESKAELFSSNDGPAYLRSNTDGIKEIRCLDGRGFKSWVLKYLDTYVNHDASRKSVPLSDDLAAAAVFYAHEFLPPLRRFAELPVFTSDGHLIESQGFNFEHGIYVDLPDGYQPDMSFEHGMEVINDLLADFMFETDADRCHAIAYPVTAIVRDMIWGPTPMFRFEAPVSRTGKSLLCEVLTRTISPWSAASAMSRDPEEVRKKLISEIRAKIPIIWLDNVVNMEFDTLKSMLTERAVRDRLLGKSEMTGGAIRNLWAVTINNPLISQELAGRSVRVRINCQMEYPSQRRGFRHDPLEKYAMENRGAIVSAFVALAKAAIGYRAASLPALGRYEDWVRHVGSIMDYCAIPGFLDTIDMDKEEAIDVSEDAIRMFVRRWAEEFGDSQVKAEELTRIATATEGFPGRRNKDGELSRETVGRTISKLRGRIIAGCHVSCRVKDGYRLYQLNGEGLAAISPSAEKADQEDLF